MELLIDTANGVNTPEKAVVVTPATFTTKTPRLHSKARIKEKPADCPQRPSFRAIEDEDTNMLQGMAELAP